MHLQLFTKWYVKYILFALCCVLLLVVPLFKGPWVGSESLLDYRLAQDPSWYDPLSTGGRFAAYSWGTALVLSAAPEILVLILPFLLGLLSFLLFRKIVSRYSQDECFLNISSLFLILSPAFLYIFSFTNHLFIAFFLSLSGFYFFTQKQRKWLCIPILALLPLFNIIITALLLILLFFYSFFAKKDRRKLFTLLFFTAVVSSVLYYSYIIYHTGYPHLLPMETVENFPLFQKIFFDLGSSYGLGVFLTLLAGMGIGMVWSEKYTHLFSFFAILFLLISSFFFPESLLFLSLFLIFFATSGFISLMNMRWESRQYKNFILLILLSGLVFSSLSQMTRLVNSQPDDAALEAIQFLSEQKQGVVFSDYSRGVWINAAGDENVLDENYLFVPDAEERYRDSTTLFYSRELANTTLLFDKYNISYIWIDDEMKTKIWDYDTEGLLFILKYTEEYSLIYRKNGVEIWSVKND